MFVMKGKYCITCSQAENAHYASYCAKTRFLLGCDYKFLYKATFVSDNLLCRVEETATHL